MVIKGSVKIIKIYALLYVQLIILKNKFPLVSTC